jgi:phosphoglycerate kinase
MKILGLDDIEVAHRRVLVRIDLDVDEDYSRLEFAEETLDYLLGKMAKLIIIGHKGRPEGKVVPELSLVPLASVLGGVVGEKVNFVNEINGLEAQKLAQNLPGGEILLLENLRFDLGEEHNDETFAKNLSTLGEVYVNEAFADSHRAHASIVGIPKFLPHAAGIRLVKEVETLSKVLESPQRPLVLVIGGIKKDKIDYIKEFTKIADKILVGGRLPLYFKDENPDPSKVIMAKLIADTEDITIHSIEKFKEEINKAGTIVVAGVQGKYEDKGHRQGTEEIFRTICATSSFKIAGGGDAEAAITEFGLNDKFDWISVGGGAMLQFLAKGTLPGLEALLN